MKHTVEVMIPEAEIKARIAELGRQITERYKDSGSDMVLVGLLRGSFMFMADLCREVQVSHEVDFMTASSYGSGMSTTRDVKILKDLDEDIRGKDVLIVEDIIDSGNTLSKVREILSLREPKSLAICTLLDKPSRREVNVPVEFIGFSALPSSAVYRQSDSAGRVSVKLPDVLHPAWHFYLWLACFSLRLEIP